MMIIFGGESRCYKCYAVINGNACQCIFCEHCSIYYRKDDGVHRCSNRPTWCGTCTRLITNKDRKCLFCNFSSNINLCCPGCGGIIDDICGEQLCPNCSDTVIVGGKDPNYDLNNY